MSRYPRVFGSQAARKQSRAAASAVALTSPVTGEKLTSPITGQLLTSPKPQGTSS